MVFKNFPLRSHQYAKRAALAALAADRQGLFWAFHDRLFANYKELSEQKVRDIARELKLDREKFEADWKDPSLAGRVQADIQQGRKAGVRGTPTVFVNGRRLEQRSMEGISKLVDEVLKKSGEN